jgi:putative glutamine amidotransferase
MAERPLIGVLCDRRLVGAADVQLVTERYLKAVIRHADVDAVLLPALPEFQDARRILRRLDGLFLTGSPSNVDPARYADPAGDAAGPFDPARDETALALIGEAIDRAKPVFGVCRGFQEVNVAFGGSLQRDLAHDARDLKHHTPPDVDYQAMFAHSHPIALTPGGVLEQAFGASEIEVNSVHFQGIETLGKGLAVEARAPDGVIEAIRAEATPAPVLAVQWHPEWQAEASPASLDYFHLFGAVLRGAPLAEAARLIRTR